MDQDVPNPSEINRKRKLQPEFRGMPMPKHKCTVNCSIFNKHPDEQDLDEIRIKGRIDQEDSNDMSKPESAEDSNSFSSTVVMSVSGGGKSETEFLSRPSSSSVSFEYGSLDDSLYSADSTVMMLDKEAGKENLLLGLRDQNSLNHEGQLRLQQIMEEHLLRYGNHVDLTCSDSGSDCINQCTDDEAGDFIYSNGATPNNFILSSGRWSIIQDAHHDARKPTIDQEFEQYFSMLML